MQAEACGSAARWRRPCGCLVFVLLGWTGRRTRRASLIRRTVFPRAGCPLVWMRRSGCGGGKAMRRGRADFGQCSLGSRGLTSRPSVSGVLGRSLPRRRWPFALPIYFHDLMNLAPYFALFEIALDACSGLPLRLVEAISSSSFSLIDSYMLFEAPLSELMSCLPRFAASAAPAAFC